MKQKKYCTATAKHSRKQCRCKALANGKCRFHGGLSTGPKSFMGRVRALRNLKQYRHLPEDDLILMLGYKKLKAGKLVGIDQR